MFKKAKLIIKQFYYQSFVSLFEFFKSFKFFGVSKTLFYLLIFLLPINLGKHFVIMDSYVHGMLIDYLVPTLYIQDILILLIIVFGLIENFRFFKKSEIIPSLRLFLNKRSTQVLSLFIFSLFLSVLSSEIFIPSVYFFTRIFLYFMFFIYVLYKVDLSKEFEKILFILGFSTILVCIVGIAQFFRQSSLFNNYLFFGEQPYSISTQGINIENLFGVSIVPSYGFFRHPNTFAGFLCIVSFLFFSRSRKYKIFIIPFLLGVFTLFLTLSYISIFIFILSIVSYIFIFFSRRENVYIKKIIVIGIFLGFSLIPWISPIFNNFSESTLPSIYRRSNLVSSSYELFKKNPLFGIGLNNFTVYIDDVISNSDIRFTQPVHNIFLLILSESGLFSLVFFIIFLGILILKLIDIDYKNSKFAKSFLLITLLQFIALGSYDHYVWTMHQTHLLMWLSFGFLVDN